MRNYEQGRGRRSTDGGRLTKVSGALLIRRFSVREPDVYRVVETVAIQKLTSINKAALCELAQTVMDLELDGIEGDFLQAGCGFGGAAIVIAYAKRRSRVFTVYDPFNAGFGAEMRMREEFTLHGVDERLSVTLVAGAYEETLVSKGALALVHLDCGEYDPMRVLLERTTPRLVSGGHLIIDDYKTREESKRAVNDYFHGKAGFQFVRKSRLHVIKIR